ncbi:hypothetical protein TSUD_391880 [Trifolium subterraneum]|uniref:Uncharacterized protein n=1 Tax=Trifolium subterraneum TaxID=3900 RepID=A0A2Z6NH23_TRISU|nr:hypothetical protein TSUD_391880 [Trifolium subterraneum]
MWQGEKLKPESVVDLTDQSSQSTGSINATDADNRYKKPGLFRAPRYNETRLDEVFGIATELMRQGAMLTVLSGLLIALAWPAALLSATDFIDSIWSIAIDRSDKAGKLLAEVLLGELQGNRCSFLLAAEFVKRVVLLGAPIVIKDENWEAARKVGRNLNFLLIVRR